MRIATTTEDFAPYFNEYTECIEKVAEAGFKYIDLSMYIIHNDDALLIRDDWENEVEKIKACAERLGVKFVQAHSPGGRIFDEERNMNMNLFNMHVRSVEVCAKLGIPNIVVHPGFWFGITKEDYFEYNIMFYKKLLQKVEHLGVNILVENCSSENLEIGYSLTKGSEMVEIIKAVNHPLFHACWDTGHANTIGTQYEEIMEMGEELYALHINDNRGTQDEHIMPYLGTLNLDDIMHGLIDSRFKGYFTFESCRLLRPSNVWFGHRHSFPKDTRLLEPTFPMHMAMEKLMFEIGKYALSSYNCYEE